MIPFLITIDVEGDNLWAKPRLIETRNAAFLPRFQSLCERYQLKPTYLTDFEMATDASFVAFGRDVLARDSAEIGMHLHAWNSPPLWPLTNDDIQNAPHLIEYAPDVQRRKIALMTGLLEDTFAVRIRSHRAGRWAIDEVYAAALRDAGYEVDCSVTPTVDWRRPIENHPTGGGADYRDFPAHHYWLSEDDISRAGSTSLLEVPMTVVSHIPSALRHYAWDGTRHGTVGRRALRRLWPTHWLRPNGSNLTDMRAILDLAKRERRSHVEFMLHSSELMPGGSPTFRTEESIERLYGDLEALFAFASNGFIGKTLSEFRMDVVNAAT